MDKKASEHGRALAELGAAKGGRARAKSLTPEERSDIARYAARRRWGNKTDLPRATHTGELHIGNAVIPCAVLEDGTRLLTQWGFYRAIGRSGRPAAGWGSDVEKVAPFLALKNLTPYVSDELADSTKPLLFMTSRGTKAYGYRAQLLPKVCEIYLQAREEGALLKNQLKFAKACEILTRGLAHVGIIALVDEATGYQADRAKDELIRILEAYISRELLPWTKRFPEEFFQEVYRLHGWQFKEGHHKRPQYVGKLINNLIYQKLPPGVLPELQRRNPTMLSGYRRHKHHQFLTADIGNPQLDKQVVAVTTLMRASEDKHNFKRLFDRAFPHKGQQLPLALEESNEEK